MIQYKLKLKELRTKNKLSQYELAKILNLSQQSISKWENSKTDIAIKNLIKLAKYFDVTTNYLLGLED